MNTSIHSAAIDEVTANSLGGRADFKEQYGRTGTLSMFFDSADDAQAAANGLASLAKQMRKREEPELARHQPCGCIVCKCEDEEQCQGCGARNCGKHLPGEIPTPVFEGSEVMS